MRWQVAGLCVCAGAGVFALGHATAGSPPGASAYERGLTDGRAQGVLEGRAEQETSALPPAARDSAKTTYADGYRAGTNDAFAGYDGGWTLAAPYAITLREGGTGVTYRFATRTPFQPGVSYFLCPHTLRLCQEPRPSHG